MFGKKRSLGQAIRDMFGMGTPIRDEQFDALEDALLEADIGPKLSMSLVDSMRTLARSQKLKTAQDVQEALAKTMTSMLKSASMAPGSQGLDFYLFLGVNGVGKTTSMAKFAHHIKQTRPELGQVFAAGDTFRAAACQQIELHGTRLGIRTVSQGQGADSAAVIFDALNSAQAKGESVVLADTAGRLHNKAHLVKELEKVDKVIRSKIGSGRYHKVLVLDAGTGSNGVEQARVFHEAVGVDAVILSKYDSEAKGGMVLTICQEPGLGIAWIGTGESYQDLKPFDPEAFGRRLAGL